MLCNQPCCPGTLFTQCSPVIFLRGLLNCLVEVFFFVGEGKIKGGGGANWNTLLFGSEN